ncbi:MAG: translation initiation factor IF-3 [Akkermansia sp.]
MPRGGLWTYKYQQAKLQKNNKSRTVKLKEIKLRIGTDTNDYNVKMARTESFLDHGHKVRFQLRFRGRENAHQELGYDVFNKVIADMKTMAQVDQAPRLAGNTMHMVLSPLPAQQRVKKFTAHLDKDFDSEDSAFDAEGRVSGIFFFFRLSTLIKWKAFFTGR